MPESNQALAEKDDTELSTAVVNFEDDAGGGFEESDKESFAIPFARIVQKLSPQCDETSGEYIEEAKAGMLINSVTEELYDGKEGMKVIPCHFRRSFIEWNTRENGGGFVAEYDSANGALIETTRDEKKRDITADGTQLVDTRCHYVLIVNDQGITTPAVITMSSTQTKKSKKWMTGMQNLLRERKDGTLYNPAMFQSVYNLTTVPESNDQGNWYGWKITHMKFLNENNPAEVELYKKARSFRDLVKTGAATIDHAADVTQASDAEPANKPPTGGVSADDDDLAF